METPIYTRLIEYSRKNRISFAMPGHKNMRGLATDLLCCDVTELAATVDLQEECETVKRANKLISEYYGTEKSFILTGGSTLGVQVMLASVLKPGDTLLAFADCHMSVINTCAVCGYKLRLAQVEYDDELFVSGEVCDFNIGKDIKAVLVTSPNYYGIIKNIDYIAEKCRSAGVPLLVDEAHGAHLADKSAVHHGADMVCHSAHKTLGALTGAAYLHICGKNISVSRVKRAIRAFGTSSPSYVIAASADFARAVLAEKDYSDTADECRNFKAAITDRTEISALKNDDETRIVLNFSKYAVTGFDIDKRLSQYYGIDAEMADSSNIVLIATPYNTHSDFMSLYHALLDITDGLKPAEGRNGTIPPPGFDGVISPAEAWYADTEWVNIDEAEGRVSAALVTVYPPGTAVIVTGGMINAEQIKYIKRISEFGGRITGISDNKIEVVKWRE